MRRITFQLVFEFKADIVQEIVGQKIIKFPKLVDFYFASENWRLEEELRKFEINIFDVIALKLEETFRLSLMSDFLKVNTQYVQTACS